MANMECNRQFDAHTNGSNSSQLDSCADSGYHCEQKLPPGLIGSQPATKVINETVEPPQISIPLGVTPMEEKCLIRLLISGNHHQQINAVQSIDILICSIALLLPHNLSKSMILIFNFEFSCHPNQLHLKYSPQALHLDMLHFSRGSKYACSKGSVPYQMWRTLPSLSNQAYALP